MNFIISIGNTCASGGYYIASGGDVIIAHKNSILGSIGIFGGKLILKGLYDKLGIKKSPSAIRLVSQFLSYAKVDSEFFSVRAKTLTVGKEPYLLEAVIGPRYSQKFRSSKTRSASDGASQMVTVPLETLFWCEGVK